MAELIIASIKANVHFNTIAKVRIHSSGDFYNETYFKAWLLVSKSMPEIIFYAYTKSFRYWVKNINDIPLNFHLIASRGSKDDSLINLYNLKRVEIFFSEE